MFYQVHKAYMRTDMIPDEQLVEECLDELDEHENLDEEVDFAEGLFDLFFMYSGTPSAW